MKALQFSRFSHLRSIQSSRRNFSSSPDSLVKISQDENNGVVFVRLNNPKTMNALTVQMGEEFKSAMKDLSQEKSLRCVVLTGEGKAFSAGGDFKFLDDRANDTTHNNAIVMRDFYERFLSVRDLPVPVISAINGAAIGAGLCLALATDIRVASTQAKMGVTFASLGIHPGMGGSHFLPKLVGPQMAAYLLLSSDIIDGVEAQRIGLVARAVEPSQVVPTAVEIARKIAAQSPVAVQTTLRTLRGQTNSELDSALWTEANAQAICYAAGDIREGMAAFREKRPSKFPDPQ